MKSNVMKLAWDLSKEAANEFGLNSKSYFVEALKLAWFEINKPTYNDYKEYENTIISSAEVFSKTNDYNYDDLLSEGNLAFIYAVDSFKYYPNVSFRTYLFKTLKLRLFTLVNKIDPFVDGRSRSYSGGFEVIMYDDSFNSSYSVNPEEYSVFKESIDSLGLEAKEVIEVLFNTPDELVELIRKVTSNRQGKVHLYRKTLTRFLRGLGWKPSRIENAYGEIANMLELKS